MLNYLNCFCTVCNCKNKEKINNNEEKKNNEEEEVKGFSIIENYDE